MAEVKIKFSAETAAAQKQLEELRKVGEATQKRLAEGGQGDRRTDLEALRAAKEQLATAEAEKKELQEKIKLQAQTVKQAQDAVNSTKEGTAEHRNATRELEKQRAIMSNLTGTGKIKGQAVDVARNNLGLARRVTHITPQVNPAPAVSGFARIRAAGAATVAGIKSGFAGASAAVGKVFTGMRAMAGAALAYVGINSVKGVINELDNLSKHARSLDIDTASFQKLKYAADSNNVSFEQVESSIGKMKRTLGEAANGSAEAEKKLAMLGLTVKDFEGKTTAEQFDLIAQSITSIQDPAQRTAAAMKWFEEGGAKMLDFLRNYKQQGDELAARGAIIDDAQLKAAEEFNQALTDVNVQLKAMIVNSGNLSKLTEFMKEIVFFWTGGERRAEDQGAKKGVYKRRTAAAFAAEKLIESGNYTPEQQQRLRKAAVNYGTGKNIEDSVNAYSQEYALIDAELKKRGLGALARQEKKGWFGIKSMVFGEDTVVTAKQTEEERRAEAEKLKKEKEAKAAEAAARAEKQKAAAEAAAKAAEKEKDGKVEAEIRLLEERHKKQQMINQGKGREVAIEEALARVRKQAESLGRQLSPEQEQRIRNAAGASYDLSHPAEVKASPQVISAPKDPTAKMDDYINNLKERYRLQQMINQGKGKEAAIEEALTRARKQAEGLGTKLTAEQEQRIRTVTAASYDLSHPAKSAAAALQPPPRTPDNYVTYGLRSVGGMIAGASRAGTFSTDYTRESAQTLSAMQTQLNSIEQKLPGRTEITKVRVEF